MFNRNRTSEFERGYTAGYEEGFQKGYVQGRLSGREESPKEPPPRVRTLTGEELHGFQGNDDLADEDDGGAQGGNAA